MAEGLLRKLAGNKSLEISSAGTAAYPGVPATHEAVNTMLEEGIDISAHRSRALDGFMLEEADVVFVMTEGHRRQITEWFKSVAPKVRLLREYDPVKDDEFYPEIPDPLTGTAEDYHLVKELLKRAITEIEREL